MTRNKLLNICVCGAGLALVGGIFYSVLADHPELDVNVNDSDDEPIDEDGSGDSMEKEANEPDMIESMSTMTGMIVSLHKSQELLSRKITDMDETIKKVIERIPKDPPTREISLVDHDVLDKCVPYIKKEECIEKTEDDAVAEEDLLALLNTTGKLGTDCISDATYDETVDALDIYYDNVIVNKTLGGIFTRERISCPSIPDEFPVYVYDMIEWGRSPNKRYGMKYGEIKQPHVIVGTLIFTYPIEVLENVRGAIAPITEMIRVPGKLALADLFED